MALETGDRSFSRRALHGLTGGEGVGVSTAGIDPLETALLSYEYMMTKQAISVTLHRDNITWLKGRLDATGSKSVSELVDRLVTSARLGGEVAPPRSVVGTIQIDPSDPTLEGADAAVRALFDQSLGLRVAARARRRA